MEISPATFSIIALLISGLALIVSYFSYNIAKQTSERDQTRFDIETKKNLRINFELATDGFVLVSGKNIPGPRRIKISTTNTGNTKLSLTEITILDSNEIIIEEFDLSKHRNIVIEPSKTEIFTFPISISAEVLIDKVRVKDSESTYFISQKKS